MWWRRFSPISTLSRRWDPPALNTGPATAPDLSASLLFHVHPQPAFTLPQPSLLYR